MDILAELIPKIQSLHILGYWIAFGVAFLDVNIGFGLLFPGSLFVLILGALANYTDMHVAEVVWFALAGAIIGDYLNFYLGQKFGGKWGVGGFWFFKPKHIKKANDFIKRHGVGSIFLARFIPGLKETVPFAAGASRTRRMPFLFWNALGVIGWSILMGGVGYIIGASVDLAGVWFSRATYFLAVILFFVIIFYVIQFLVVKMGKPYFRFAASLWRSIRKSIIANPDVKKLVSRHPRLFAFLGKRLDKHSFYGRPLTIISLVLLYVLVTFGGVVEDILTTTFSSGDMQVANLLAKFRSPELTRIFLWITAAGRWPVVVIFIAVVIITLWLRRKRAYILPLLVSVTGSEIFVYLEKLAFHRPRPATALFNLSSYSFPSGHATIAVSFYGFVTYLMMRTAKRWRTKVNVFFGGLALIILLGFSRLYLGVHYLSDVWGGYLLGMIWLLLGVSIFEWLGTRKILHIPLKLPAKAKKISLVVVTVAVLFYVGYAWQYNPPLKAQSITIKNIVVKEPQDILSNDQLRYTETLTGAQQEPISFIIVAPDDSEMISDFEKSGWLLADKVDYTTVVKIARAAFLKEPYPTAPMSPDFWNSQVHDFGFEQSTEANNARQRHHARFWKTDFVTPDGEHIYVGTASFDSGIKWGVTHRISPNIDTERDYLFNDLKASGTIVNYESMQFAPAKLGKNFSGDTFFTDGNGYVVWLK